MDEPGFQRLYAERIEPCFVAHEADRVAAVTSFNNRVAATAPIVLAASIGSYFIWHEPLVTFFVFLFFAVFACAFAYVKLAGVSERVKLGTLTAIAEAVGVKYSPSLMFEPPALGRLLALHLLPGHSRANFEDWFSGEYEGANFDLYEAHLETKSTDSKGRTSYSTVFRGQVIRLTFPRKFLGRTIVRRDAGWFNAFGGGQGLERVRLVDPTFEKTFEVYGSDQVEARYLVHPVLMERLLDLETSLHGQKLRCAFEYGDLLIAVEGGNLFEPGDMFKPLADPARARRIVEEIGKVLRVMDSVLTAQAKRG